MSHESPIQNKQAIDLQGSSLAPIDQDHAIFNWCTNSSPIFFKSNYFRNDKTFSESTSEKDGAKGLSAWQDQITDNDAREGK